eukprot:549266_1
MTYTNGSHSSHHVLPQHLVRPDQVFLLNYSCVVWTTLVIRRGIDIFLTSNRIISFSDACNDGSCLRCNISERAWVTVHVLQAMCINLVLLDIWALNNGIANATLKLLHIWFVVLGVTLSLSVTILDDYELKRSSTDHSYL